MIAYDFRCTKCDKIFEEYLSRPDTFVNCGCGGIGIKIWVKAPGVANKAKGIYPYYDTQLGRTLESPQHRDQVLNNMGLVAMGAEEHKRTLNNHHEGEENYVDKAGWRDAAEQAWNDIKYQNVPLESHRSVADVEADVVTVDNGKGE